MYRHAILPDGEARGGYKRSLMQVPACKKWSHFVVVGAEKGGGVDWNARQALPRVTSAVKIYFGKPIAEWPLPNSCILLNLAAYQGNFHRQAGGWAVLLTTLDLGLFNLFPLFSFTHSLTHTNQPSSFIARESQLGKVDTRRRTTSDVELHQQEYRHREDEVKEDIAVDGRGRICADRYQHGEHWASHGDLHSTRELHDRNWPVPDMGCQHVSLRARPAGVNDRLLPERLQRSFALAVLLAGRMSRWVYDGVLQHRCGVCYSDGDGVYMLSDVRESSLVVVWTILGGLTLGL